MIKEYTLSDCIDRVLDYRGKTPGKLGGDWAEKGIRVISALNVHGGYIDNQDQIRCVSQEIYDKWMQDDIQRNDCFLASEGASLGENAIWDSDEKVVLGQRLYAIRTNPSILDPWYFAMYMQTDLFRSQVHQVSTGSTVFGISQPVLLSLKLLLPDIKDQRVIGQFYRTVREKILNNNAICSNLEAMAKLLYDYWFVQFDFPDENGEPYKSSGGKMVWNDELKREIPAGWGVNPLKGLYKIERGLSYSSNDIATGEGVPMINLACIDRNRNYRDGELKYHSGLIPESAYVNAGDMLIACTDLTRERDIIGCPILVPDDGIKYIYSMDIAKISFPANDINDLYMYMTLRTDFYHNYIKTWASGTNVLHLNLEGLDWYNVCIPPVSLQNEFANMIRNIHSKKSEALLENQQLASLRDFLLPMLMNGQVKINTAEA